MMSVRRLALPKSSDEIETVFTRHTEIRNQDIRPPFLHYLKSSRNRSGPARFRALSRKTYAADVKTVDVVVDQQHFHPTEVDSLRFRHPFGGRRCARDEEWKRDRKNGT